MKGMKKRFLALFLTLTMVLGMFPATAFAGTESADEVYISVSHDGDYINDNDGEPVRYLPVKLSDLEEIDLDTYGLSDYKYDADSDGTNEITALHLYIYTHERIMGGDWDDVRVSGGAGSIFFEGGLFDFTDCNLQYYYNGAYPAVDGWGITADQLTLQAGDFLDIASYTSWAFYGDSATGFHYFLDDEEITHSYSAVAGEPLTVTLGRSGGGMGGENTLAKVSDYTVTYYNTLGTVYDTVTTDSEGQAEITFEEAGTYYLSVLGGYGAENPTDIVSAPAYAEVIVEEGEEAGGDEPVDSLPLKAFADGEEVEIVDLKETVDCLGLTANKLSVTAPAGTDTLTIEVTDGNTVDYVYGDKNDSEDAYLSYPTSVSMDEGYVYLCFTLNDDSAVYHVYIYEKECDHNYIDGVCEHCLALVCEEDPDAHYYVDGACDYCGKPELEPTLIVNAGTGWSSIEWPYRGCNINKIAVNNVKVDNFTVNGSTYYITLDSGVADDASVELGIGTNLQYSNLWVLVDGVCITESPISASTELTHNVQLETGAATVVIGGCPGYNTGKYIQQYAVNKTFHFSTKGLFPVAPMLAGGSSAAALRVQNTTWEADLSTLFKNVSDSEMTYKVAINGAEAVDCEEDYSYTCDTYGTTKLVFTAANDYGTSPNYTVTISVLPEASVKEVNYEVEGGTIEWFAFTDDKLNPLPEGTTYAWDEETVTYTIIQPSDINVTGKVMTFYNLVKDDPAAKLPLLSGSNAIAGAGTHWDGGVRNQQTNTLSNGAVNAIVYLYEHAPTSNSADQYTTIKFNYDRQKPETYFEYKVDGNAELTIVGDVGGVNGHQWTGDREVRIALSDATPVDAIISCVEKSSSVTLSNGAGQFTYKTGNWWEEKTWTVKYQIDQMPGLKDSEATSENVEIPCLETYTIDLEALFTDPDETDILTYQVKQDDGAWTNIEGKEYSFTPEAAQDYTFVFRAFDGFVYTDETYTVNMTALNAESTYTVSVNGPADVQFYCGAGFDESGADLLGVAIEATYEDGVYTLSVPTNVSRISWRKGDIGMSAAVAAEEINELTLIEADFTMMAGETEDEGTIAVKYDDYAAVGLAGSFLLLQDEGYTYVLTPANSSYRAATMENQTPVAGETVFDLVFKHITVIAPKGSTVSSGKFYSYFRYDFNEAVKTTTLEDERISVDFPVPGSESFIRVQHPDGVTYWDFGGLSDGSVAEVTEEMLFIGSEEYNKETVYPNYEKNSHDKADLYMTVNAQGWLDMESGDVHSLNIFRNWIPVANSVSNNGVSLPDVEYKVVSIDGTPSDVVTVTPDKNNSCYADIQAVKAGTAIILVSYDAVYNADGEGGKQFSAIWPENTGVIVVTVDAEASHIQTNMTVNEKANAGGKQIIDVEHDILFYVGDAGAEYSFKPEAGCTVSVARSTVDDVMTFDGFETEGVIRAADGTFTVTGLTTGTHIIKVEKEGETAYQVIRAREVSYVMTHSDGSEVTKDNPAAPGESITVQFSGLIDPQGKLSGVYNANFGFYYNGEDGSEYRIASGYAYGDYYFGSNAVRQRFTATVPADWNKSTYTLLDGGIKLGGYGSAFGAHRSTSYLEGKDVNTNASGTAGVAAVLPDVIIPTTVEDVLTWEEALEQTEAYLTAQAETSAPGVGSTNGEWQILGLARHGSNMDSAFFDAYYAAAVAYVNENIDAQTGRLHASKSTDNSRLILALTSMGKDVTDVNGHNLLQGLSDMTYVKKQGLNGPVWALIALDSRAYEIPANGDSEAQVTREWLIDYILDQELTDGGWKISGTAPDDMTPMAVQALAPYYDTDEEVKAAVDRAVVVMTGMIESASPETCAQIIVALSTLGIDCEEDERFEAVMDQMLTFVLEDGSFEKSPESGANQMSTEQAFYALVAYNRYKEQKTSLYDMTDVIVEGGGETDDNGGSDDNSGNEGSGSGSGSGSGGGNTDADLEFGLTEDEILGYVTVSFEDKGIRKDAELSEIDAQFHKPLGTIIKATKVPFKKNDTIASVTLRLLEEKEIEASYEGTEFGGFYLEAIGDFKVGSTTYDSFGEFDAGQDSGWMITWNDWFIDQGASEFEVEDGDVVRWQYTCQLGHDIGDDRFDRDESGSSGATNVPEEQKPTASVTPEASVNSKGEASVEIKKDELNSAVEEATKDNTAGEVVIVPEIKGDASKVTVELPKESTDKLAAGSADLTVKTDIAEVTLPAETLKELPTGGKSVTVAVETVKGDATAEAGSTAAADKIKVEVAVDNKAVESLGAGVAVTIPAEKASATTVLVIVDSEGKETIVKKSAVSEGEISALLDGSCTVVVKDNKKEFTDTEGHWGKAAAEFASSRELFNGVGNGQFGMNMTMNRAMMATVFYNLENAPDHDGDHDFHDVHEGRYYEVPAAWAAEHGVLSGYTDGSFRPDAPVTREQLAVMLWNYSGKPEADKVKALDFSDTAEISNYAKEALQWAVENGVMSGRTGGKLDPKGAATRAEVAQMFKNYIEKVVL